MFEENDGVHIEQIIKTTTCKKHRADEETPCWAVFLVSSSKLAPAVCGARIRRAGFVGKISPSSLSQKTPGGRKDVKKRR